MSEALPEVNDVDHPDDVVTKDDVMGLFEIIEGPAITTSDLKLHLGVSADRARELLRELVEEGHLASRTPGQMKLYWRRDPDESVEIPEFLTTDTDES